MENFIKNNYAKIKPALTWLADKIKKPRILGPVSIVLAFTIAVYAFFDIDIIVKRGPLVARLFGSSEQAQQRLADKELARLQAAVLPQEGVTLPVVWGGLGNEMVTLGVIDAGKLEQLYAARGGLGEEDRRILSGADNGKLKITAQNSGFLLNMFWALGLANKNEILEKGPMMDKKCGGNPIRFASTGGWTLAKDNAMNPVRGREGSQRASTSNGMNHYSKHSMMALTPEQQEMVVRVSQGIYRPCCGNSTHFPDCNHGMAMLGLLELMASQGVGEDEMYRVALAVNSYWFPDNYLTIAKYLESKNISWDKANPKDILGADVSSGAGYNRIRTEVEPVKPKSGGSCGV